MVELIVTAINVFILFFLIGYLVSDMLSGMLTKRQERIADDINTARMSKEEALALKNDYEHRLADFESERADILENTRRKAAQMEERILLDGQQEADRVIARAKREAELKKTKHASWQQKLLMTRSRRYIFRKCWMRWVNQHGRIN